MCESSEPLTLKAEAIKLHIVLKQHIKVLHALSQSHDAAVLTIKHQNMKLTN